VVPADEANEGGLTLGLFGPDGKPLAGPDGAWVSEGHAVFGGAPGSVASAIGVRVRSDVCCGSGSYPVKLTLRSAEGDGAAFERVLQVPIEYAGFLACYGKRLLAALIAFTIGMMVWLVIAVQTRVVLAGTANVDRFDGSKSSLGKNDLLAPKCRKYTRWKIFFKSLPLRILLPVPGVKHYGVLRLVAKDGPPFVDIREVVSAVREGGFGKDLLLPGLYRIANRSVLVVARKDLGSTQEISAGEWRIAPSSLAGLGAPPGGNSKHVAFPLQTSVEFFPSAGPSDSADAPFAGVRFGA
jgi:hypothetical protein